MQSNGLFFPEDIYKKYLTVIKGVNFTSREIDVMACLLNMQGAKKIAALLSISPNTVWTHDRNIMSKIGCNSRQEIIDFIERSHNFSLFKKHYANLIKNSAFEKTLNCISKRNKKEAPPCLIIYEKSQADKNKLMHHLENHFKQAGLSGTCKEAENFKIKCKAHESQACFLILEKGEWKDTPQEFSDIVDVIDISEQLTYSSAIFEILTTLLPEVNVKDLFASFREQSEGMENLSEISYLNKCENEETERREERIDKKNQLLKGKKIHCIFSIICALLFFLVLQNFKGNKEMQVAQTSKNLIKSSIRSDLIIPTESALLHRPEEMTQITEKFTGQKGIQTVALIGPGGAGKTTLARQYTHQVHADVIWEVNAETPESLRESFETLAQALAQTEEDQKILKSVLEISNLTEREEKVISFVKIGLKAHSPWALVFDNMEKFADIQKHFPQDAETWGKGKIILTTRDHTIQNNKHIHSTLQIGELTSPQKLTLFTKIMTNGDESSFSLAKREEANQFLKKIPPYPLDVTVAAYYLKTTNAPFEGYVENIDQNNKSFAKIQESLLKEAGSYTQTRYGILTLSLQRLINTDKDFSDLLFFISLLDSQNIPRELLVKYKNNMIVDNFILNLKKYSLITGETSLPSLGKTLSLHRSTQSISLAYLLDVLTEEKKKKFLHLTMNTLDYYIEEIIYKEDLRKMSFLIGHLKVFLNHDNLLDNKLQGELRSKLGYIYYHLRDYINGKKELEKSFEIFKTTHLKNPTKIVDILMHLSIINMELFNYEKAKSIIEKSLRDYSNYFSEIHMNVAKTFLVIGDVYGVIGEYKKAKEMLKKSLCIYDKSLLDHQHQKEKRSAQSPIKVRTLAMLGNVYCSLGKYDKALELLEKSLKMYEDLFPDQHFDIAAILVLLGNTHINLGEYEKGVTLLERGTTIYKKNLPEDHLDLVWASVYLGNAYEKFGDMLQAQKVLERSLKIYKELLGENNIGSAWTSFYLGKVYIKLGKISEGKILLNQTLIAYEKNYGKSHIETGRVLKELGEAHFGEGDLALAESYFSKALELFQKNEHTDQFMVLESLAQLYTEKSKLAEAQGNEQVSRNDATQAISFLRQALEIVKTRFPEKSPHLKRLQLKLESFH